MRDLCQAGWGRPAKGCEKDVQKDRCISEVTSWEGEIEFHKFNLFILFLAALALHCGMWAFSSCGERGLLYVAVCGLLIVVASLVAEHGL